MNCSVVPFPARERAARLDAVRDCLGDEAARMMADAIPAARSMREPWRAFFGSTVGRFVLIVVREETFPPPWPEDHPDHGRHFAFDIAPGRLAVFLDIHNLPDLEPLPTALATLIRAHGTCDDGGPKHAA